MSKFTLRKTSCLSAGSHPRCRLTEVAEGPGKYGPTLTADFKSLAGDEKGRSIREFANLEYDKGEPVFPSMANKLGRLLAGLSGIDVIDDDVDIDPTEWIGSVYRLEVGLNTEKKPTVSKIVLVQDRRVDSGADNEIGSENGEEADDDDDESEQPAPSTAERKAAEEAIPSRPNKKKAPRKKAPKAKVDDNIPF